MRTFSHEVEINDKKYNLEFELPKTTASAKWRAKALGLSRESKPEEIEDFLEFRKKGLEDLIRNKPENLPENWIDEMYSEDFEVIASKIEVSMKVIPDFAKNLSSQGGMESQPIR